MQTRAYSLSHSLPFFLVPNFPHAYQISAYNLAPFNDLRICTPASHLVEFLRVQQVSTIELFIDRVLLSAGIPHRSWAQENREDNFACSGNWTRRRAGMGQSPRRTFSIGAPRITFLKTYRLGPRTNSTSPAAQSQSELTARPAQPTFSSRSACH